MAVIRLTKSLKEEYSKLFNSMIINSSKIGVVDYIVTRLVENRNRYNDVTKGTSIPWYFVSVIHAMETSISFSRHLHNGDTLTERTKHHPAGRPKTGTPPFTWEESAIDAIKFMRLNKWNDWSLEGLLYKLEAYNGFGYRLHYPHVLSPYLWSFSNHYSKGKYVADGRWSDAAVSRQCGGAVLLRRMAELNFVELPLNSKESTNYDEPILYYTNERIPYGEELQKFLNTFPGIYLRADGRPGRKTSDAFYKVTGHFLSGDEKT
ncbi:MAG: hypothetical protein K9J16_12915 [Melioribacteraceae bacterium]|nr:hypothetical protein [Melioribacteraceae bacterium]MCF8353650.1 hypothetical protein [Melioribacteraceae bacterium]MCF8393420.1 hypothetical protein [Melioribacteraceae bacterium]MCF8419277.1 hypothetical protein [Melioribacteraceae bacterium]